MTSQAEKNFISYLNKISSNLYLYFSYSAPWLGLSLSTVAFLVLLLRKRREKNLIIFLFTWQYAFGIIFSLNMLFNDPQFSLYLFSFGLRQYVSDPVCKISNMFLRFFYCISPWIQVVIYKIIIFTNFVINNYIVIILLSNFFFKSFFIIICVC